MTWETHSDHLALQMSQSQRRSGTDAEKLASNSSRCCQAKTQSGGCQPESQQAHVGMTVTNSAWSQVKCQTMLHDFRSAPCSIGKSCYTVPNGESRNRLTNVGQNLLALGLLVLLADLGLVRGSILGVAGSLLLLVLQPLLQQAVPNCDTRET